MVVAGYDPLHDEGLAYARRLSDSGVPMTLIDYPGGFHGFLSLAPALGVGRRALAEVAASIRRCLATESRSQIAELLPS